MGIGAYQAEQSNTEWETLAQYGNRSSKDKLCKERGKLLAAELELTVANGLNNGDKDGNFTFVNHKGASVIDLCLVNINVKLVDYKFEIIEMHDSRHFPIKLSRNIEEIPQFSKEITRIEWNTSVYEDFKKHLEYASLKL